jgi:hypothetical protein
MRRGGWWRTFEGKIEQSVVRVNVMAVGSAVQRGSLIYVYDEKGRRLTSLLAGKGPKDGLQGYNVVDRQRASRLVDLYLRRKRPAVEFDIGGAMTTTIEILRKPSSSHEFI